MTKKDRFIKLLRQKTEDGSIFDDVWFRFDGKIIGFVVTESNCDYIMVDKWIDNLHGNLHYEKIWLPANLLVKGSIVVTGTIRCHSLT